MTKRFLLYVFVATATLCLIMYIRNPALLDKVWLWIVGLFAPVTFYAHTLWKALQSKLGLTADSVKATTRQTSEEEEEQDEAPRVVNSQFGVSVGKPSEENAAQETQALLLHNQLKARENIISDLESKLRSVNQVNPKAVDNFPGSTIHLLRYLDDGATTLGLLYIDNQYFCYTLEDTFRQVKIRGKTRIPEGDFEIKYQKTDTKLTLKYREKAFTKGWFTYHLHIQNVPGFEGIYIHSGGDHNDTDGCILVSDSLSSTGTQKTFNNSKKTFELLYKKIAEDLDRDMPVRIRIYDEKWFSQTMIPS